MRSRVSDAAVTGRSVNTVLCLNRRKQLVSVSCCEQTNSFMTVKLILTAAAHGVVSRICLYPLLQVTGNSAHVQLTVTFTRDGASRVTHAPWS